MYGVNPMSAIFWASLFILINISVGLANEPRTIPLSQLGSLRLNQIQVIGTHNSYHLRPKEALLNLSAAVRPDARQWDYSHAPLDVQLDRGVRSFELDLHLTPNGWEVFHVPILDQASTCPRLKDAFALLRRWSDKHPHHIPISILMEMKDEGPLLDRRIRRPDAQSLNDVDKMLLDVLGREKLITPDDVRGERATLEEAVKANQWPTITESAGKFLVVLHETGETRALYLQNRPSLEGRMMFVNSESSLPFAAVIVMDNPRDPDIPKRVQEGYFVRTRADAREPQPSLTRRDKALASGAHIVSTDFPAGESDKSGYVLEWGGKATARVNPINGPKDWSSHKIVED